MATSGPNIAGTGADDAAVGTSAWFNPENITADDGGVATQLGLNGATSHYLKGTSFGFSIPSGATVNGILVEWERVAGGTRITDTTVKLVQGGSVAGNN